MAAKKEPFGGKQATPFGQGKTEQKKAKPGSGGKGRERADETKDAKKKVK
jgi:hypothetical protein